jgi:hypothetical protein
MVSGEFRGILSGNAAETRWLSRIFTPKLSDFLLDLHQSLAHQGLAKSLDISIGMPTLFANLAASRSWHISSQKIAQLRLQIIIIGGTK